MGEVSHTQKSLQLRRYPYLPCPNHAAHNSFWENFKNLFQGISLAVKNMWMGEGKGMGIALQTSIVFVKGEQSKIDTTTSCGRQLKLITTSYKIFPQTSKTVKGYWCPEIFMTSLFFLRKNASEKNCQKTSILPAKKNTTLVRCLCFVRKRYVGKHQYLSQVLWGNVTLLQNSQTLNTLWFQM